MSTPPRCPVWIWVALAALVVLELAWFAHFWAEPLPNSGSGSGPRLTRSQLLWRSIPGLVPGIRNDRALLPQAARELSHWQNLPQRLPPMLAAAAIAGAALALGHLALRVLGLRGQLTRQERLALGGGVGASLLGGLTLVTGRAGLLTPWSVRLALFSLIAGGIASRLTIRDQADGEPCPRTPRAALLLAAPFLVIMALGSMLPTIDFDAIEYHLQGPKEYFLEGRIAFLPHNVYTSMPFNVEMLHLLGMEALDDWWWGALAGQLLVASYAPLTALILAATAARWGSPRAGWVAGIVYLSTPWIYRLAVIPYVEGPLCFYHAALAFAAGRAWSTAPADRPRWWTLVGLLAGGAMACKYTGFVSAVVPFAVVALADAIRRKDPKIVLRFAVGFGLVMAPWLAKNVMDTGNPVYPLASSLFPTRHWTAEQAAKWAPAHGPKPIQVRAFVDSVLDVAGRSDWQSPLFVALAPLAFVRRGHRRVALALSAYAAYVFLSWWLFTHRLDRFWLPILPTLAVLAGLGADALTGKVGTMVLAAILAAGIASNAVQCTTSLTGLNEWTADLTDLRTRVPRLLNAPLARLDAELPPGAVPLLVGQAAVFHLNHRAVYNTVFNPEILETLTRDQPTESIRASLADRGITHVYVDWHEIERYRSPGNYGFTSYVQPEVFARLIAQGILGPPTAFGSQQDLYAVVR
ncbi:glycosyltransferase family 39 protein [Isosphaeraceae bacterium EP7]